MRLAKFIRDSSTQIVCEWEEFARTCVPGLDLEQRRDHVAGMLTAIALDLEQPQTKREQAAKSKGEDDADVDADTAANAHGTDRAAFGYTPMHMVSEFRALRASVLRLWAEAQREFSRADLDDVTRFNEAIDQALAESIATYAQDVDNSKDLFLGVLGHDLRSPLGAIMMSATTMMTQEEPDWTHARSAARILSSVTRMDAMIRDLLDFTRSRLGGGIPVVSAAVDLEAVVRQTVDEIASFHPRCRIQFEATGQLQGEWDRGRIGQAVSNLVGNARQHGSEDTPIEIALRGEAEQVVLTVKNQGPAIARRHLHEIFSPFRQLDATAASSRVVGSIGLGLYIAKSIVTAHKGTLVVESGKDGTTFTMRLPR